MTSTKIQAGSLFPRILAWELGGNQIDIAKPREGADWKMVVIYRGWHCPLCTSYLNKLESYVNTLSEIGIDLVAVSADSQSQLEGHLESLNISFSICYGLTIEQMQKLGLYISIPRSDQETDHPFSEPGVFVINEKGQVQVVDISNGSFARPELEAFVAGLGRHKDPANNFPIRGTYQ